MSDTGKTVSELADLLKGYIARSKKTQRQVAEEAGVPNPSYLSHMANGRINWVESDYFRPIADALGLKTQEIAELKPDLIIADDIAPRRPNSDVEADTPRALPQGLQDAIDQFGAQRRYADLLDPKWQQYLAGFQWRDGVPDDPNSWLDLYRDLDRAGVVPGNN